MGYQSEFKMTNSKIRCFGNKPGQELYAHYHDDEWGIPVHEDQKLFEMLILEGAQAGLSWETILKRRIGYQKAFHQFDPIKVAAMSDSELEALRNDPAIIRNRLKIYSTRLNAQVFLTIQAEFGSFDRYLWDFVQGSPIINHWTGFNSNQAFSRVTLLEMPVKTAISDALSKDLARRGMKFVGSTIMYAYMQAIGMVNDHFTSCWRYNQ